jgi:hypothetical protein
MEQNAVHDVNMKPIFTCIDHFDVALQVSKSAARTDGAISVFSLYSCCVKIHSVALYVVVLQN